MTIDSPAAGKLYYIVGPSGAGKDTLLRLARQSIGGSLSLVFAHRYITRPHQDASENHVALTDAEFHLRARKGCFAMQWASHGYRYAVGVEIIEWLKSGLCVMVSGSREYLPIALKAFPDLRVIWISAPAVLLRERLETRGREDPAAIAARLARAEAYAVPPRHPDLQLDNTGNAEQAAAELVAYLKKHCSG
ncbi:MAG TPA: phosphonate metabolism protein/1,5-bisphosphokinase (PRPP-forming) PhnN [Burkholderiales bacterium]|nr:phosphonate metabolism protein/1,5-bisphosphokinase (PRPP-forming) PhnN [Burkholderiales bacterium]